MKHLTYFACLFLIVVSSFAQEGKTKLSKLYAETGGGVANHNGGLAYGTFRAVLSNNWTYSLAFHSIDMDPKNLPADYVPTINLVILIPISDGNPSANLNSISLTAGRVFPLGRSVWMTTDAGLSLVKASEFKFVRSNESSSLFYYPSNYNYSEERKTTVGGLLQADITWAFASFAGVGVGAFAGINSLHSPVGFQVSLKLGKLRSRY